jgi:hypothetical protein
MASETMDLVPLQDKRRRKNNYTRHRTQFRFFNCVYRRDGKMKKRNMYAVQGKGKAKIKVV